MEKKKITIATHNGSFHSDDIFGVACLCLMLDSNHDVSIIRTRDQSVLDSSDYVVDVGGEYDPDRNRFDHHQRKIPPRSNDVPYAALGLVWKKFGLSLCGGKQNVADFVEKHLVYPIDARDNGIDISTPLVDGIIPYELRDLVAVFKATWREDESVLYDRFIYLLSVAKEILKREIIFADDLEDGKSAIRQNYLNMEDKRLLILDSKYPFEGMGKEFPDLLLVVYPDESDGKWCLECQRDIFETYKSRIYLPESWAGLSDKSFAAVSGVPDVIFCHKARFFAVAKTKEAALKLAEIALNQA